MWEVQWIMSSSTEPEAPWALSVRQGLYVTLASAPVSGLTAFFSQMMYNKGIVPTP